MPDPIDLGGLPIRESQPEPLRLGGTVRGALGGAQIINRMGDRWAWKITTRQMPIEPEGRRWGALLDRALQVGATVRIRQPNRRPQVYGSIIVRQATAAGRVIPVAGMAGAVGAGDWVSVIVDGRRYLDKLVAQSIAAVDGTADLQLLNLLRAPLPQGAIVELAPAVMQGSIEGLEGGDWSANRMTSFSFTLVEDA